MPALSISRRDLEVARGVRVDRVPVLLRFPGRGGDLRRTGVPPKYRMAQPETSLPKLTSCVAAATACRAARHVQLESLESVIARSALVRTQNSHFGRDNVVRPITCVLILLIAGSVEAQVAPRQADAKETTTLNLTAYAELLRSDVRAQKVAIITEVMNFTEAEDKVFWPIYREFDLEMAKLGDERVAMIAEYARNYSNLTDAMADKLAGQALDLEARRQALKASTSIASRRRCRRARPCAFCRSSINCCC